MLTAQLLKQIFPLCADPAKWTHSLNPGLEKYQISTRARPCCFLAQTGHESGQLINK